MKSRKQSPLRSSDRSIYLPVFLVFFTSCAVLFQMVRLLSSSKSIDHSDLVINQTQLTQRQIAEVEGTLRTRLLSETNEFPAVLETQAQEVKRSITELRFLLLTDGSQLKRFNTAETGLNSWINQAAPFWSKSKKKIKFSAEEAASEMKLLSQVTGNLSHVINAENLLKRGRIEGEQRVTRWFILIAMIASGFLAIILYRNLNIRLRSERALKESESKFHELFEHAPDGIFVATQNGEFIDVNTSGAELLGYTREELMGMAMKDLVPAEDISRLEAERKTLLRPNTISRTEWRLKSASGEYIPVEVSAKFFSNGYWHGFVRDIHERKDLEERRYLMAQISAIMAETLTLNERLDAAAKVLIQNTCDWCVVDLVDDKSKFKRIAVQHRDPEKKLLADKMKATPPNESSSTCVLEAIASQKPVVVSPVDCEQLKLDYQENPEYFSLCMDLGFHAYIVIPLMARGNVMGAISLVSGSKLFKPDVVPFLIKLVDRIALSADNSRLYEVAQQAIKSREDLVAIVSHDLKTPLTTIGIAAQMLQKTISSQAPELLAPGNRTGSILSAIRSSYGQAITLISDLLDFGKISAGRFFVAVKEEDPLSVLTEALAPLKIQAEKKEIEITVTAPHHLELIAADRSRLIQVITNLVGNSIKFIPEGGKIHVSVEQHSEDEIVFTVADNGPGICETALAHIFDRYWQPKRDQAQGTGLGLCIAKGIVEAHDGKLWVESKSGEGCKFSFSVPKMKVKNPGLVVKVETENSTQQRKMDQGTILN